MRQDCLLRSFGAYTFVANFTIASWASGSPALTLQVYVNGSLYDIGPSMGQTTSYGAPGVSGTGCLTFTTSLKLSIGATVGFRIASGSNYTVSLGGTTGSTYISAYYFWAKRLGLFFRSFVHVRDCFNDGVEVKNGALPKSFQIIAAQIRIFPHALQNCISRKSRSCSSGSSSYGA